MRTEIFGRTREKAGKLGQEGCGYLGKIVSYPGGRYEESGKVLLDLVEPHCMLVLGKRGTGKSYTLGVVLENFSLLPQKVRDRLAVVVIDTMSVFHSLKTANTEEYETRRMKDFDNLNPASLDNINIIVPKLSMQTMEERGGKMHSDVELSMRPDRVAINSWLRLFNLRPTDSHGSLLLSSIRSLGKEWTMEDLKRAVQRSNAREEDKRGLEALLQMADDTLLFSQNPGEMIRPGCISILDISYLGRMGNLDLRAFVVAHMAETLLRESTLHTTLEMQTQAGLVETAPTARPLVWLVIDEAHIFLPAGADTLSTQPLIDWIKLGRHPGMSIIMATQEPSALHETAIKQADMVISHQITAEPDIVALGKARQSFMTPDRDLPTMVSQMDGRRGLAIVFDDKSRKMEYCMIRPRMTLHTGMDACAL
ncbi:MAG: zonular occludens toxin domain-containing protein [Candidatus Thermoplasmatota archaeon]|nr:zonular occludens toxin domain-containing protein [Candidatus Thermoplasmatota archaeon]